MFSFAYADPDQSLVPRSRPPERLLDAPPAAMRLGAAEHLERQCGKGSRAELSAERHTLDLGDAQIQSYLKGIIPFVTEHGEDVAVASRSAEEILTWLVALVYNLEENELRAYTGRIHEFWEAARREVREMLVMKLHDKLLSAQGELKKLNRRLRQHRFEGLTYIFDWQIDPVKRPLYEMARRVAAEPDRADALLAEGGEPILDQAVALIRDIFRSDGGSTAGFEDYRQYFTYELRMTHDTITDADIDAHGPEGMSRVRFTGNLTDRVGKGSGGQKQTPYYVAIAASMAAAYYPASRLGETQGLGLVCFDEAFSKLDIRNTQELIRFFRDLSLQIVVAAPEEKRTSFMELMDTMVNISKLPGDNILHITSERIGPRAKAELEAANPERIGIEGYRRRIEAEAATPAVGERHARHGLADNGPASTGRVVNGHTGEAGPADVPPLAGNAMMGMPPPICPPGARSVAPAPISGQPSEWRAPGTPIPWPAFTGCSTGTRTARPRSKPPRVTRPRLARGRSWPSS